MKTTNPQTQS